MEKVLDELTTQVELLWEGLDEQQRVAVEEARDEILAEAAAQKEEEADDGA